MTRDYILWTDTQIEKVTIQWNNTSIHIDTIVEESGHPKKSLIGLIPKLREKGYYLIKRLGNGVRYDEPFKVRVAEKLSIGLSSELIAKSEGCNVSKISNVATVLYKEGRATKRINPGWSDKEIDIIKVCRSAGSTHEEILKFLPGRTITGVGWICMKLLQEGVIERIHRARGTTVRRESNGGIERRCPSCGRWLDENENFGKNGVYCKECLHLAYEENKEEILRSNKKYRLANPEKIHQSQYNSYHNKGGKEKEQERRTKLIWDGLCGSCGKNAPQPGNINCDSCQQDHIQNIDIHKERAQEIVAEAYGIPIDMCGVCKGNINDCSYHELIHLWDNGKEERDKYGSDRNIIRSISKGDTPKEEVVNRGLTFGHAACNPTPNSLPGDMTARNTDEKLRHDDAVWQILINDGCDIQVCENLKCGCQKEFHDREGVCSYVVWHIHHINGGGRREIKDVYKNSNNSFNLAILGRSKKYPQRTTKDLKAVCPNINKKDSVDYRSGKREYIIK